MINKTFDLYGFIFELNDKGEVLEKESGAIIVDGVSDEQEAIRIIESHEHETLALALFEGCLLHEAEWMIERDQTYFVGDSDACDDKLEELANDFLAEALAEIPKHLQFYFDEKLFMEEFVSHESLSSCLGEEGEQEVDGNAYYIYKL